jgi:hypothetical protein
LAGLRTYGIRFGEAKLQPVHPILVDGVFIEDPNVEKPVAQL